MDILKAEIARKKQMIKEKEVLAPDKKYFKRADLAAKLEEEYWQKNKKQKLNTDGEAGPSTSSPRPSDRETDSPFDKSGEKVQLSRKEVVRRLRDRDEPIRLFGESDAEGYQRLKKIEMLQPEINKGFNNDFKAAMDMVDKAYLDEMLRSSGEGGSSKQADVKVKDDGVTIDEILKMAEKLGTGDTGLDSDVILGFLKLVLKTWGDDLNKRTEQEKRSMRGKMESATHTQTVSYIKPLFRKLKKKDIDEIILSCLVDITKHLLDRHYINANDAYLEMAIGNAPWPIGVTMVGIHARTGREKIFARNVAHVLNDETQRKYIQAVKRLMTQCQKYFPTDPSRSVDFDVKTIQK